MLFFYDIDVFRSWISDELKLVSGRIEKPKYYHGMGNANELKEVAWSMFFERYQSRAWIHYKGDCVWMSLYFWFGALGSIWMFDGSPGVMSNQETAEKWRLMKTCVALTTGIYVMIFLVNHSIPDMPDFDAI